MKTTTASKKEIRKRSNRLTQEEDKESNEEAAQDNLPEDFSDEENDIDNIVCIYAKSQKKRSKKHECSTQGYCNISRRI